MGLHVPFIGYTRPGGQRAENIREFFGAMNRLPDTELGKVIGNFSLNNRHTYFDELVFENDTKSRTELNRFINRERPKSLVIANWEDLFEAHDYDQTIIEFREYVLDSVVPVICVRDIRRGFNLVDMQLPPERFIAAVEKNEMDFRESIKQLRAQLKEGKKNSKRWEP